MSKFKIALLSGDGIGPVMGKEAGRLLELLGQKHGFTCELTTLPFGKDAFEQYGDLLPEETVAGIRAADAALLSAVDAKGVKGPTPLGSLRKKLDLYADVRTIRSRPGRWSLYENLDLVTIRDVTQGFLSDRNLFAGHGEWMSDEETAFSMRVITYSASKRIADYAFRYALQCGKSKVTAVHKASIFKMTCGTFLKACRDTAALYPSLQYSEEVVDDVANRLIADPQRYDILLTTNLFGDILSDEAAALVSSLAPSVNEGTDTRVYLPVKVSPAYDLLQADTFDPLPTLLCLQMMLQNLTMQSAAKELDEAISFILALPTCPTSELLNALRQRLGA